jgi:hypothetical protein
MKKFFVVFSSLICFGACAPKVQKTQKILPHYFQSPKESPIFATSIPSEPYDPVSCRARIERLVCLVEPVPPGEENTPRDCVKDVDLSRAVNSLQAIYDAYPPALQSVFCRLGQIFLEKKFYATAYASSTPDGKQAVMGFRADLLLGQPRSLSEWVSWKEQLSFGGAKDYSLRDDLVKVRASSNLAAPASDFIYFVIAHEFGHVLDAEHTVSNDFSQCTRDADPACVPKVESWTALSWAKVYPKREATEEDPWNLRAAVPNDDGRFAHREELCFYGCRPAHGKPELMAPLYASHYDSNFITTYAATNVWDDFAETVAFYSGTRYTDSHYDLVLPDGTTYDLADKYKNSTHFRAKREWVERFFQKIESQF